MSGERSGQELVIVGVDGSAESVRAVSGVPARELVAASADADLVVVGSRGGGGFARIRLGSVSNQVASHADSPVVVIR